MTTPTPPAGPNDDLIDAAQKRADLYHDDPRQDIVTDVMNAFFAGATWKAARAALAVPAGSLAVQPVRMLTTLEFADIRAAVACGYQEDIDGDYTVVLGQAIIRQLARVNGLTIKEDKHAD